jgi:hypothetical protein
LHLFIKNTKKLPSFIVAFIYLLLVLLEWVLQQTLIRLKLIYNFWCSMLSFTPFALSFVTLCGIFMHFLELTY